MENLERGRRATDNASAPVSSTLDETVRHGILLQQAASTVAAVEHLMARGVDTGIIRRVLAGQALREADRMALALQREARRPS